MNMRAGLLASVAIGAVRGPALGFDGEGEGGGQGGDGQGGGQGGGGASGAGGAAELLNGDGQGGGGQGGGDGQAAGQGGDGGELPEIFQALSAQGEADQASNRDWVKTKGFKDLDGLVKSYRETEKMALGRGIKVPGDDAKPEEIKAFHKAIGVPEKADEYEIKLPEGIGDDVEIDASFAGPMKEAALAAGVPKAAFDKMGAAFVQWQMNQAEAERSRQTELANQQLERWGVTKDTQLTYVTRAMQALELSNDDIAAIQSGYGSDKTLALLAKLGGTMAEDPLIGGGRARFGMSAAEAQKRIDEITTNPEIGDPYRAKLLAKDPATVAEWDRLNDVVAAEENRKRRASGL